MSQQAQPAGNHDALPRRMYRVAGKALILFVLLNLVFGLSYPLPGIGRLSWYNRLVPGRLRLPYADNPSKSYNLSLYSLEAMFASHEISGVQNPDGEFRVLLIGDSNTWGYLLEPDQTLASAINESALKLPDGRRVKAYNLGYPVMSLMKDLVVLSEAMRYHPDLIVWLVTLESFPYDKQLSPPLLQNNTTPVRELIRRFNLHLNPDDPGMSTSNAFRRSLVGSRRELADWARLQLYGLMWAATGIDQDIPASFTPAIQDLSADLSFHSLTPPALADRDLAFEIIQAGIQIAGGIPLLVVNEPMLISKGVNSDLRYNYYYPRWAYDQYRDLMVENAAANNWHYLDLWDVIPPGEFTNSAVHLSPAGTQELARRLAPDILSLAGASP